MDQDQINQEFLKAAQNGKMLRVVELINAEHVDINCADQFGNTALMKACQNGDEKLFDLLVKEQADIHRTNQWGNNALHACFSIEGRIKILKQLVDLGADINALDNNGMTPFQLGVCNMIGEDPDCSDYLEYLIQQGADIWIVDRYGHSGGELILNESEMFPAQLVQYIQAEQSKKDLVGQLPEELGKTGRAVKL